MFLDSFQPAGTVPYRQAVFAILIFVVFSLDFAFPIAIFSLSGYTGIRKFQWPGR